MFFAIYINSMLYDGVSNINFMYVVSPPQDGLPFLNENHGWLVYVVHYAALVLFCVSIAYIKPIIDAIKAKLSKKTAQQMLEEATTNKNAESN
jgi:flagellar biosynthesis/type III secretory pathway M-ring protein FliF/YscJ